MSTVEDFYTQTKDLERQVFLLLAKRKAAFPLQIASELRQDFVRVEEALRRLEELRLVEPKGAITKQQVGPPVVTLSEDGIRLALSMRAV